mmetsp:Transcript_21740/g.29407  ORF Transcript_21740/g.29407 Transcript_21740/m.29407 type:complete len:120 (-) Transcript_21740:131-490(-)
MQEGATAVGRGVMRVHGVVQRRLFEGEAPTLYRLRANKYAHCYGAQKRESGNMQHLAPYLTTAVLGSMAVFFIAFPLAFQQNYSDSKRKYETFARQHADQLNTQFDRGQFSDSGRRQIG